MFGCVVRRRREDDDDRRGGGGDAAVVVVWYMVKLGNLFLLLATMGKELVKEGREIVSGRIFF